MARLELSLPEELGTSGDVTRSGPEHCPEVGLGRTDGAGEPLPIIVRWFETWATADAAVGRSP